MLWVTSCNIRIRIKYIAKNEKYISAGILREKKNNLFNKYSIFQAFPFNLHRIYIIVSKGILFIVFYFADAIECFAYNRATIYVRINSVYWRNFIRTKFNRHSHSITFQ